MQDKNQEVFFVVLMGMFLAVILVGFILVVFFLYQRKRLKQEQELVLMAEVYEQEVLRSQLEIQDSTLKTIAQELHDNIGQTLSVIKLWMAIAPIEKDHPAYEGVQNSREMLHKVIFEMSDLTKSLHTERIGEIGLRAAIEFDVASIRKTGLMEVNYLVEGSEFHFSGEKSIFLFRMYQEMMNNILKHSKATCVNITVAFSLDYTFVMTIADNGVGFDMRQKKTESNSSSGLGLKSMQNRAKLIGATIDIESEKGKGTRISVTLPLQETQEQDL